MDIDEALHRLPCQDRERRASSRRPRRRRAAGASRRACTRRYGRRNRHERHRADRTRAVPGDRTSGCIGHHQVSGRSVSRTISTTTPDVILKRARSSFLKKGLTASAVTRTGSSAAKATWSSDGVGQRPQRRFRPGSRRLASTPFCASQATAGIGVRRLAGPLPRAARRLNGRVEQDVLAPTRTPTPSPCRIVRVPSNASAASPSAAPGSATR